MKNKISAAATNNITILPKLGTIDGSTTAIIAAIWLSIICDLNGITGV